MGQVADALAEARTLIAGGWSYALPLKPRGDGFVTCDSGDPEATHFDVLSAVERACAGDLDLFCACDSKLNEALPYEGLHHWLIGKTQADVLKLFDAARLRAERGNK